ncbi:MAG TPA: hypothetical protein VGN57_12925 [Pirellulaceae bacterium]|jgi:hypothetical protein|nr:hypothetical protein [Pirellulaceae bacterium]
MVNPYSQWLGLPADLEKPNYFHLLRIKTDVTDPEAIAQAAQRATLKVKSQKPGEHALEWTQLIGEIETARQVLSDPELRKAYIKRLLAEKKAREEAKANVVASSAFVEAGDEEPSTDAHAGYDDEPAESEDEDDPMAAWSAAYGAAKPARPARPAGVKGIGPKGAPLIPAPGAPGAGAATGPVQVRRAVKGRKKPGALAYTAIAVVFLLAVGGAAFGAMVAFQMFGKEIVPGVDPNQVALGPGANPAPVPPKNTEPVVSEATGPATIAVGAEDGGGFGRPVEADPAMQDPMSEDPAMATTRPGATDPFASAAPATDPELAASAAPDDPFFVEPTLKKFGYAYDADAAVAVMETTSTTSGPMSTGATPSGRELTDEEKAEVNAELAEVRQMLIVREVPQAEQKIAALLQKFEGTQAEEKIEAIQLLTQKFRAFWVAVLTGSQKTTTGVPLDYSGTSFSLVEATPQMIVVRFAGENKRWAPVALPGGLAKFFAEAALTDGSANSQIVIGTIYALENGGAKADQAREYWERAASSGEEETVQKLLPLLEEKGWSVQ